MSNDGQAPPALLPLDPGILTPNDLKRVKVALGGQAPEELMNEVNTLWQLMLLAVKLRTDPEFTWDLAGDTPLGEVFDVSGAQSPPAATTPDSAASSAGSSSKRKPSASAPAPPSAASTG
jgi:hypothetical protein